MIREELAVKVREIKKKMRLTEGKMANILGVETRYIADILEGRVDSLPWNTFSKIEYDIDSLDDE